MLIHAAQRRLVEYQGIMQPTADTAAYRSMMTGVPCNAPTARLTSLDLSCRQAESAWTPSSSSSSASSSPPSSPSALLQALPLVCFPALPLPIQQPCAHSLAALRRGAVTLAESTHPADCLAACSASDRVKMLSTQIESFVMPSCLRCAVPELREAHHQWQTAD